MEYSVDGDFGRVRMVSHLPTQTARSVLNFAASAGWHRCNDRYRIVRPAGIETWLLFFTVGGCGQMKTGGQTLELPPGSVGLLPLGKPHEYGVPRGGLWEFYWLHLGGLQASAMLAYLQDQMGPRILDAGVDCAEAVEKLMSLKNEGEACYEIEASRIIGGLLHDLAAACCGGGREDGAHGGAAQELMRRLEAQYQGKVSIEQISRSLYISPTHLSRLFRKETGLTPVEYLMRYRIMKAKQLLQYTDESVGEIARLTGFAHASHFIAQFKALEGITPGEYRRN